MAIKSLFEDWVSDEGVFPKQKTLCFLPLWRISSVRVFRHQLVIDGMQRWHSHTKCRVCYEDHQFKERLAGELKNSHKSALVWKQTIVYCSMLLSRCFIVPRSLQVH